MKLLTEREQARSVLRRHIASYPDRSFVYFDGRTAGQLRDALEKLSLETATAADIKAVVGNDCWCTPQTCHECGESTWDAVELGEEPDYESRTATICAGCLTAALRLVRP